MTDSGQLPRADWYSDPTDPARMRYWDGQTWTADTRQLPPPELKEQVPIEPKERRGHVGNTEAEHETTFPEREAARRKAEATSTESHPNSSAPSFGPEETVRGMEHEAAPMPVPITRSYEQQIQDLYRKGYTVQLDTPTFTVMAPRKPNHAVHAILSLLTAGLWLFVWLFIAATAGKTVTIQKPQTNRGMKVNG